MSNSAVAEYFLFDGLKLLVIRSHHGTAVSQQ